MKKRVSLFIFFLIIVLIAVYFVGKITEQKTREIIAKYSSDDMQISIVNYEKHFFSADVTTQLTFKNGPSSDITIQVISEITHYPYKAVSLNHLSFLDKQLNDNFTSYFSTDNWFISKEEFTLWGTLEGTLTLPAGHYEENGEIVSSEAINIHYDIDLKNNNGSMNLDWPAITVKTETENIQLEKLLFSSTFSNFDMSKMGSNWQSVYDLKIAKLTQTSPASKRLSSLYEDISLSGGSENNGKKERVNTTSALKIKRYQQGEDEKMQFLNNEFAIEIKDLYQPALINTSDNAIFSQQTESVVAALINHGFNFSIPKLHSQTPWGDIDGEFNMVLNEGGTLIELLNNPYLLLDYGEGELNLSVPKIFLNFPRFGGLLVSLLNSGFLVAEDEKLILDGTYKSGELIINNEFIPL